MEQTERKHNVFVSYAHVNLETAQTVVSELERNGIRCWYADRDLSSGVGYAGRLTRAIRAAKVFLLLFSEESNVSDHVLNEVDIAFKTGRVIVPIRLSGTRMSDDMEYYLTRASWIDATHRPLDTVFRKICGKVLESLSKTEPSCAKAVHVLESPRVQSIKKSKGTLSKERFHEWANPPVVKTLELLNTLDKAPSRAVDLSEEGFGSVLCWTRGATLYIAGEGGVYAPEDSSWLFSDKEAWMDENPPKAWSRLETVRGGANLDTSKVKKMSSMFCWCDKLTAIDVSSWDTCEVTSMRRMFYGCSSLNTLDVSGWDTSMVTDMQAMFYACSSLNTLDVSGWDTSVVMSFWRMFWGCSSLTSLDVSGWDTSMVTYMLGMFNGCSNINTLDVSNWDTSMVTNMQKMFNGCTNLTTLDVSHWDTSNVHSTEEMFSGTRWEFNPPI